MIRTVLTLALVALTTSPQLARTEPLKVSTTQPGPPLTSPAAPGQDFVGLDALSKLLVWLRRVPAVFDNFVTSEKRQQLSRGMITLANAFAKVNQDCVTLARLVDQSSTREEHLHKPFDTLLKSIVALRSAVLELASDLGAEASKQGRELAFELAKITMNRADVTEEARKQVFGGERAEAVKKLRHASELAEQAQKLVIGFMPALQKSQ
jgi:hypothetical protein